ncbi:acyl transferase/acyl hydrolase/lysophospholipase [Lasiosphaeria miniovina]|uniref:Acyl transferase/acyl hydrolase/lysophospholipase n=1 Tax=Lasiosphaeria miniovina TaxID=1954250 RepID=A0AA40E5A6_9PEZI|nr:acyl transferase/acyl hydrolase/lysophospholipase [Lasiosphaeria miniovina]KAK0728719.1 acyl transferase/acyl hydrolase/lysophospholipase [Lasiosphaeria miniovina]
MESSGLKRKDTTKGPPLRILSLDGGGVRGYSMFLIIQELMHRTFVEIEGRAPRRSEIPKPCDHFDLIVGTGTGGLIAIMLGRLRLDLETCKELYVRMTRMVFETDKTIAGIPYRSTLFKATKLEDAIKECVREHTIDEREGNDGIGGPSTNPLSAVSRSSAASSGNPRRHSSNASVVSFSARSPAAQAAKPMFSSRAGNPNARLYDERENRTKTAVTAMYKGTQKGGEPALLRSYDSRREPAPEFECRIWEAGRATCAIGLAFKPIQIGQSVFHDDGAGTFNPSITVLDEAVVNEWPGRDVGVFISIGTGKRPKDSEPNSSLWYEGFLGDFAEARRKLIAKIEGCETIHEYMKKEHLAKRGVNIDSYYRLNVEVGVGEFGMNEWHRLADISTNTRRYLARHAEQGMVQSASTKLAKIHFAKLRWQPDMSKAAPDIALPLAVELPGDIPSFPPQNNTPPSRQSYESGYDTLPVPGIDTPSPRSSGERLRPSQRSSNQPSPHRGGIAAPTGTPPQPPPGRGAKPLAGMASARTEMEQPDDADRLVVNAPTPAQYRASGAENTTSPVTSPDSYPRRFPDLSANWQNQGSYPPRVGPPPLPPKTPLSSDNQSGAGRGSGAPLPYPLDEDAPPAVNLARKPNYSGR